MLLCGQVMASVLRHGCLSMLDSCSRVTISGLISIHRAAISGWPHSNSLYQRSASFDAARMISGMASLLRGVLVIGYKVMLWLVWSCILRLISLA